MSHFSKILAILSLLPLAGCFTQRSPPTGASYRSEHGWLVDAERALELSAAGAAVLDVREASDYAAGHLERAVRVSWLEFSQPEDPERGRLLEDGEGLVARIRAAGVSNDRPVVVIGDPVNGWGEDGRIVWMLRTLGHRAAAFVDGGQFALVEAGAPLSSEPAVPAPGDFVIARRADWDIEREQLKALVDAGLAGVALVDTRERREYDGQTPYGERRAGHVPGAVHLHYGDLLNSFGFLFSRPVLIERLSERGIRPGERVIAYCSGGVRSGWFVAVLADLGFTDVRNYAGSMWEWSAAPAGDYPLQ